MAGTATNNKLLSMTGSAEKASITQGNALIVDAELLRAQLALTLTTVDAAGDLTAALVKDVDGTTI